MLWSKAKTILIVFFLIINVALAGFLIYSNNSSNKIDPSIISSTISILNKNDIEISPSIIPSKIYTLSNLEVDNAINSRDDFAKKLLNTYTKVDNNSYISASKTLVYSNDNFEYIDTSPSSSININKKNIKQKLIDELKRIGINASNAQFEITSSEDNKFVLKITQIIQKQLLFNSNIVVEISNNGISKISGSWFNQTKKASSTIKPKAISGILVDFISNENRIKGKKTLITKLELGYYIYDANVYHLSAFPTPTWCVTTSDGLKFYIDARNY